MTRFVLLLCLSLSALSVQSQSPRLDSNSAATPKNVRLLLLEPAATLHKPRLWLTAGVGAGVYGGMSVALWHAWYQDYPLTRFHLFNDWGEWNDMDKSGHFFSTQLISRFAFQSARWTGMSRQSALWTAAGVSLGVMTTVEVMDGFSEEWGFSLADMGFNVLGMGFFASQELLWKEQRISFKVSGLRPHYSEEPIFSTDGQAVTNLDEWAAELYGRGPFYAILKDYNALTVWSSVNIHSFLRRKTSKFPAWLNVALGYGAGNIYGGFENKWTTGEGANFELSPAAYPRYRQFYLSPDIDLTKIPTHSRWLKFALGLIHWLKLPAPALEVNTLGKVKFHYLYW